MSTLEDREWDAYRDAHTIHTTCGLNLNHCTCDDDQARVAVAVTGAFCECEQTIAELVEQATGLNGDATIAALADHGLTITRLEDDDA